MSLVMQPWPTQSMADEPLASTVPAAWLLVQPLGGHLIIPGKTYAKT